MNIQNVTIHDAASAVAIADQPEHLSAFRQPGCAAAVWRRQPEADFQNWIDILAPSLLPKGRVLLHPSAVKSAVTELCEMSQTPSCAERDLLVDDIAALADIFSGLMKTPYLRLRLDVVTSNACRKFHVDAITGRLVCTYRGTGTQYGISKNGQDPARVFTVPTGAPVLLRGTLWPEEPASGLRHRSPPIEGTGETRLVLVLDALDEMENA